MILMRITNRLSRPRRKGMRLHCGTWKRNSASMKKCARGCSVALRRLRRDRRRLAVLRLRNSRERVEEKEKVAVVVEGIIEIRETRLRRLESQDRFMVLARVPSRALLFYRKKRSNRPGNSNYHDRNFAMLVDKKAIGEEAPNLQPGAHGQVN